MINFNFILIIYNINVFKILIKIYNYVIFLFYKLSNNAFYITMILKYCDILKISI